MSKNQTVKHRKTRETVTLQEAARRLGITAQAVGKWAGRSGAPVELTGTTKRPIWPDFPRWREAELDRQIRSEVRPAKPESFEKARERKLAAEAELAELQLERERQRLITLDDAQTEANQVFDRLRARIVALPGKEAHRVLGVKKLPDGVKVLRGIVETLLAELSGELEELADG